MAKDSEIDKGKESITHQHQRNPSWNEAGTGSLGP
jgi:hypothetical protein